MTAQNNLKLILFEKKVTQRELSKRTKIPESWISYFMNSKFMFDPVQRAKIAAALGVPEKEIFN